MLSNCKSMILTIFYSRGGQPAAREPHAALCPVSCGSFSHAVFLLSPVTMLRLPTHKLHFDEALTSVEGHLFVFSCTFILLSQESNQKAMTSSLRSCRPPVYHIKLGEFHELLFPTAQQLNLSACSPHCPFNAERQAGKL